MKKTKDAGYPSEPNKKKKKRKKEHKKSSSFMCEKTKTCVFKCNSFKGRSVCNWCCIIFLLFFSSTLSLPSPFSVTKPPRVFLLQKLPQKPLYSFLLLLHSFLPKKAPTWIRRYQIPKTTFPLMSLSLSLSLRFLCYPLMCLSLFPTTLFDSPPLNSKP